MPNFDKKGPAGKGPKTGRGLGDCGGPTPENADLDRGPGRGLGKNIGRGLGRGFRLFRRRGGRGR